MSKGCVVGLMNTANLLMAISVAVLAVGCSKQVPEQAVASEDFKLKTIAKLCAEKSIPHVCANFVDPMPFTGERNYLANYFVPPILFQVALLDVPFEAAWPDDSPYKLQYERVRKAIKSGEYVLIQGSIMAPSTGNPDHVARIEQIEDRLMTPGLILKAGAIKALNLMPLSVAGRNIQTNEKGSLFCKANLGEVTCMMPEDFFMENSKSIWKEFSQVLEFVENDASLNFHFSRFDSYTGQMVDDSFGGNYGMLADIYASFKWVEFIYPKLPAACKKDFSLASLGNMSAECNAVVNSLDSTPEGRAAIEKLKTVVKMGDKKIMNLAAD